jgi:D-ribose pyranose/furanose isomerase RbsD
MENVESSQSVMTIEDLIVMLPESVATILQTYEKDLPDYEHVHFILQHEVRGDFIVLSSELAEHKKLGKALTYRGDGKFIIEPYSIDEILR